MASAISVVHDCDRLELYEQTSTRDSGQTSSQIVLPTVSGARAIGAVHLDQLVIDAQQKKRPDQIPARP